MSRQIYLECIGINFFDYNQNLLLDLKKKMFIQFLISFTVKRIIQANKLIGWGFYSQFFRHIFRKYQTILKVNFYKLPNISEVFHLKFIKKILLKKKQFSDESFFKLFKIVSLNEITINLVNEDLTKNKFNQHNFFDDRLYLFEFLKILRFFLKNCLLNLHLKKLKIDIWCEIQQNEFSFVVFNLNFRKLSIQNERFENLKKDINNFKLKLKEKKFIMSLRSHFVFIFLYFLKNSKFFKKLSCYFIIFTLKRIYFISKPYSIILSLGIFILKIVKFLKLRHLKYLNIGWIHKYNNYSLIILDILFNIVVYFYPETSRKYFYKISLKLDFYNFSNDKKCLNLYGIIFSFLKNCFVFYQSLKNFVFIKKILFFISEFEIIVKYGDHLLVWLLKKTKFELATPNNVLNNLIVLFLSKYFKINLNLKFKRKIRKSYRTDLLKKNNIFNISLFIHMGILVFYIIYRRSTIEIELKKTLKCMGIIIKIYLIKGYTGKILAKFFYSSFFLYQWTIREKKIFWKNWLFYEVLKSNKKLRNLLFIFRKCYFITIQHIMLKSGFY